MPPITGPRLIQQATLQAAELFHPNPSLKQSVEETFVPMLTDWVVKGSLKQSGISADLAIKRGALIVTSPKRPFIEGVQWGQDFEDYKGNPLLAITMLMNHGDLGKSELKRVDLYKLKQVAPALHRVLRDIDNKNMLAEIISGLPPTHKEGMLGKALTTIQRNIENYRVGLTLESKNLRSIPITSVQIGDGPALPVPDHLQGVDLKTLRNNLPTITEFNA